MTYQTPDGWRLPHRCPQHAAPFGSSTPLRIHTHRALRLFVTAGAWAAGLCLIVASVALVAKAAGPARATHVAAAAGHYPVRAGQLSGHGGSPRQSAPTSGTRDGARDVLRTFAGTGNRTTSQFTVAAHGRWELRWSYQCPAQASGGRLVIMEGNAARGSVSVDAAGAEGQGSAWAYSDAGTHYLVVITNCAWTARILGHR